MKANELRIGNWVMDLDDGDYYQVCEITKDGFTDGPMTVYPAGMETDDYGIPITNEWVLKFGFKYNDGFQDTYQNDWLELYNNPLEKGWRLESIGKDHLQDVIKMIKIEYVHQLQNLYFALTGEELQIKEGSRLDLDSLPPKN